MMRSLHIGRGVELPPDYVTKTAAILAQRRKGKTYSAAVIAEELTAAGLPWVALDPTGAWWGMRAGADGSTRGGLPVVILGGHHSDVPLERTGGHLVADLVVDHPGWYVIDFSDFESGAAEKQFVTDFVRRLYRYKGQPGNDQPMHLFVDEAQRFVPQQIRDRAEGDAKMLGAFETLVLRGGVRGLGTTLISQRAASVNKNVLEQLDMLIVLRTVGPNDRDQIENYIRAAGEPAQRAEMMASLAGLGLGQAWLWEPGAEPPLFMRMAFRKRHTFNSSATPKAGETRVEPTRLADVDLDALNVAMADTIERLKADDPAELRRRIGQLEAELRETRNAEPAPAEVKLVEVPLLDEEQLDRLAGLAEQIDATYQAMPLAVFSEAQELLGLLHHTTDEDLEIARHVKRGGVARASATFRSADVGTSWPPPGVAPAMHAGTVVQEVREPAEPLGGYGDGRLPVLKAGARRMMEAVAGQHPMRLTRRQVATLARVKVTGGTFGTYWSTLTRAGLIVEASDGKVDITDAGRAMFPVSGAPSSTEETLAMYRSKLKAGARRMLDVLVAVYPAWITDGDLAGRAEVTVGGGTFGTYLSTLVSNGLAAKDGHSVRAHDDLFLGR